MRLFKRKIKPVFLTITEIQQIMREDKWMPTAIFSATRTEYIVPARTIFSPKKKNKNLFTW